MNVYIKCKDDDMGLTDYIKTRLLNNRVEQYNTTLSGETVTGRTLLSTERYYYDTVNRLTCTRVSDSDGEHSFRWTYDSNNTSVSGKRYGALKRLRSG